MFRERIRMHYDHLSRSYRRVADFILSDYRTAAFMTAAALATAVGVDTTTVVRFAQRIGYPGYPELIQDVQAQVKSELTQGYVAAPDEATAQASIQRMVAQDRANLEKALAHNDLEALEQILTFLRTSERIVIFGESYAAPLAASFAQVLADAGLPAVYVGGDAYDRARSLLQLGRKDLVVGVTPLEGVSAVARVLEFARSEGAITLACTPGLSGRAARAAAHLLYAPGDSISALPSLTSLYALMMALAQAVAAEQLETLARRGDEITRVLEHLA